MNRREWMSLVTSLLAAPSSALAENTAPLLLGIDTMLDTTGLAARWRAAVWRDTGISATWITDSSTSLLKQLESGALPMALFFNQPLANQLEHQGLIHDRHTVAQMPVMLMGPQSDPAGLRGESDLDKALNQILIAQASGACRWQTPPPQSALFSLHEGLIRGLSGQSLPPQPATQPPLSYRLITLADWSALSKEARRPYKIMISSSPRLSLQCQVARSFKLSHPAGKLLAQWLQGPTARRALTAAGSSWQTASRG